jgi:hypothetical protein
MKIKTTMLAVLLALAPVAVRAQDVDNYENYQVGCNAAECNNFEVNYQEDEVAQRTRNRRTRRTRSTDDKKVYVGGTLGIFFPGQIDGFDIGIVSGQTTDLQTVDPGTGFGGSVYGGYKFSEYIGADVEGFVFGGDADPLNSSYTSYGFFVNPRFTYTFDRANGVYVFASPGIGVAGVDFGNEISDAEGVKDASGAGFALQAKVGAGYPVSDSLDIIGQARYFNAFNAIETTQFGAGGVVSQTEDQDFSSFSIEAGVNFKF